MRSEGHHVLTWFSGSDLQFFPGPSVLQFSLWRQFHTNRGYSSHWYKLHSNRPPPQINLLYSNRPPPQLLHLHSNPTPAYPRVRSPSLDDLCGVSPGQWLQGRLFHDTDGHQRGHGHAGGSRTFRLIRWRCSTLASLFSERSIPTGHWRFTGTRPRNNPFLYFAKRSKKTRGESQVCRQKVVCWLGWDNVWIASLFLFAPDSCHGLSRCQYLYCTTGWGEHDTVFFGSSFGWNWHGAGGSFGNHQKEYQTSWRHPEEHLEFYQTAAERKG